MAYGDTQTITASDAETTITMQIDNPVMKKNEEEIILEVAPRLARDRALVPIRAVAEGMGAAVGWDAGTRTVTIKAEE